jgi:hypothetical protein
MKVGIVAHFSRAAMAHNLVREVEADFVNMDKGNLGHTGNYRLVSEKLARITGPDEWALILEDDAIPCPDFRRQVDNALWNCGTDVASLYLGRLRPPQWQQRVQAATMKARVADASWIIGDAMLHAVAIAIRGNALITQMLRDTEKSSLPMDQAIGMWAGKRGHDIAYTWPSLAEHRDGPTLIAHPDGEGRRPGRVAWKFGTRSAWSDRSVRL